MWTPFPNICACATNINKVFIHFIQKNQKKIHITLKEKFYFSKAKFIMLLYNYIHRSMYFGALSADTPVNIGKDRTYQMKTGGYHNDDHGH